MSSDEYDDRVMVCSAHEGNFIDLFIERRYWSTTSPIALDSANPIEYLALYRRQPVSAITHYARVESVRQEVNLTEFLLGTPISIGPIIYTPNAKVRSHSYTTYRKLLGASSMSDLTD